MAGWFNLIIMISQFFYLTLELIKSFCIFQDIYSVSRGLEKLGIECAVIYGSLPPGTKLAMAERFNDPQDPCKVNLSSNIQPNISCN
jgi:hypothetical protein